MGVLRKGNWIEMDWRKMDIPNTFEGLGKVKVLNQDESINLWNITCWRGIYAFKFKYFRLFLSGNLLNHFFSPRQSDLSFKFLKSASKACHLAISLDFPSFRPIFCLSSEYSSAFVPSFSKQHIFESLLCCPLRVITDQEDKGKCVFVMGQNPFFALFRNQPTHIFPPFSIVSIRPHFPFLITL